MSAPFDRECGAIVLRCVDSANERPLPESRDGFRWHRFISSTRAHMAAQAYCETNPGARHVHTVWCENVYEAAAAKSLIESWLLSCRHAARDCFELHSSDLRRIQKITTFPDVIEATYRRLFTRLPSRLVPTDEQPNPEDRHS